MWYAKKSVISNLYTAYMESLWPLLFGNWPKMPKYMTQTQIHKTNTKQRHKDKNAKTQTQTHTDTNTKMQTQTQRHTKIHRERIPPIHRHTNT